MFAFRSSNWLLSIVSFVFFVLLFLSSFSYFFHLNFEYISNIVDATQATIIVTALLIVALVGAFTVARIIPKLILSAHINARSAQTQFQHRLNELATSDDSPLDDITLTPSVHFPAKLVDAFNRFLARVRSRIDRLNTRIETNIRSHTTSLTAQAQRESARMAIVGELSQHQQMSLTTLIAAINAAMTASRSLNTDTVTLRQSLSQAYHDTVRLTEDAKTLLMFSTTDLTLPLNESVFDFHSLVQECIDATQISCDVSANSINSSHTGPPKIRADRMRLKQIVENLLMHAHRARNSGHVSVVSILGNELLFLSVRDSALDLPADHHTPAHNVEANESAESLAAGVGLYICQNWVKSLSGQVVVRSEPGKSTTFQITLPVSVSP